MTSALFFASRRPWGRRKFKIDLAWASRAVLLAGLTVSRAWAGDAEAIKPLALVYADHGACLEDGCEAVAADVARARGFRVKFIKAADVTEKLFAGASLWIQPGGHAVEVAQTLGERRMQLIREFVWRGGRYLGFCAGGFLADQVIDDGTSKVPLKGLGIIASESYDYVASEAAMLMPVQWLGQQRTMYFQGGPAFRLKSPAAADLIAVYPDQAVAAIIESFGQGRVAVTGPHPEAPQWWFEADNLPKKDGLDFEYALSFFDRLLAY